MENGQNTPQSPSGEGKSEGKIGRVLEQARRDRGLSLEEAERATKIRKRYLAGLEGDDYSALPDAVYARGFLKTYANFLGLDGGELSRKLKSRRKPRRERGISHQPPKDAAERPIITPGGMSGTQKRHVPVSAIVTLVAAGAIVVALIGALYYVGRGAQADRGEDAGEPRRTAGDPAQQQAQQQEQQGQRAVDDRADVAPSSGGRPVSTESPLDALVVGLDVEGSASWILVEADSEVVSEQIAPPGFSRTFEADRRVSISTGNAGAVSVRVNGQSVGPLGAEGEVLTRSFTLKSAS